MFAVPGWNISAKSLKTQASHEPSQNERERSSEKTEPHTKHSRKRKRMDREKGGNQVQDEQIALLWGQYVDGAAVERDEAHNAKKKKKRKQRGTGSSTHGDEGIHKSSGRLASPPLEAQPSTTEPFTAEAPVPASKKKHKKGFKDKEGSTEGANNDDGDRTNILPPHDGEKGSGTANKLGAKGAKGKENRDVKRQKETHGPVHPVQSRDSKTKRGRKDRPEYHSPDQDEASFPRPEKQAVSKGARPVISRDIHRPTPNTPIPTLDPPVPKSPNSIPSNLTPLQQKMRAKLTSARFRHLNETLYTTPSTHAREIFNNNPELFTEYHAGFSQQVMEWPENPVSGYVAKIKAAVSTPSQGKRSKGQSSTLPSLPRSRGTCTIADLGCGDAFLARSLAPLKKTHRIRILSYDFRKSNDLVTMADITSLPLEDRVADLAIFCLSLMGTNWIECIEEAWRVLRFGGECWVSEVKSRFGRVHKPKKIGDAKAKNSKGKKNPSAEDDEEDNSEAEIFAENQDKSAKDETDVSAFVEVVQRRGFTLKPGSLDKSNKMFVRMEFVKGSSPIRGKWADKDMGRTNAAGVTWKMKRPKGRFIDDDSADVGQEAKVLKPCVYKIR
jgi:ribosomal RNA-processing protein 8